MRKISIKTSPQKSPNSKKSIVAIKADILYRKAFHKSIQANIISIVKTGKIMLANSAACKLLGYSKKEIVTKRRADIFAINTSSFQKMLYQRKSEGHSKALVTVIKSTGKQLNCEINSAVFLDDDGIIKAITTIEDIKKSIISNKIKNIAAKNIVLAESKQKKIDALKDKLVADNIARAKSKQKKIDALKDKLVAHNIVLAKSKQIKIDRKKAKLVAHNIVVAKTMQKKLDTKKDKIAAHNIVLAESLQKKIDVKKKEIENNVTLARTKSDEEKKEQQVAIEADRKESFRLIFNSSSDVLLDSDLIADKVIINDAYEKEFGYKIIDNPVHTEDWFSHIHPEDREKIMKDFKKVLVSDVTEWNCSYRFLKADNSIANILSSKIILRDAEGKAYRIISSMHENSKQKILEARLKQEIILKERQIVEAEVDAREAERLEIGKELHDNVNQLLAVSKLYLDMAKQGCDKSNMYLHRSSEYIIAAIEAIRDLTKGLTSEHAKHMGLGEAIEIVIRDAMEVSHMKIDCHIEHFQEQNVTDKFKMNVFRIIQEQLNNILKHAKATEVTIRILQNKNSIILSIADNGIGFDTFKREKGIGVLNIKNRARSYKGTSNFVSQIGQGCVLTVKFPLTDLLLNSATET